MTTFGHFLRPTKTRTKNIKKIIKKIFFLKPIKKKKNCQAHEISFTHQMLQFGENLSECKSPKLKSAFWSEVISKKIENLVYHPVTLSPFKSKIYEKN